MSGIGLQRDYAEDVVLIATRAVHVGLIEKLSDIMNFAWPIKLGAVITAWLKSI